MEFFIRGMRGDVESTKMQKSSGHLEMIQQKNYVDPPKCLASAANVSDAFKKASAVDESWIRPGREEYMTGIQRLGWSEYVDGDE